MNINTRKGCNTAVNMKNEWQTQENAEEHWVDNCTIPLLLNPQSN